MLVLRFLLEFKLFWSVPLYHWLGESILYSLQVLVFVVFLFSRKILGRNWQDNST